MPIPEFNALGDLPAGVHAAPLDEVCERFGSGTLQRQLVTKRLRRIYELAQQTGKVERFVIYGSYVTAKPAPNDVDVFLVMRDDFREADYTEEALPLFDHMRSHNELGASIFWIRATAILLESVDEFVAYWQTKRDQSRRGIIEVI
jgi:predicted nucleotidyltransferase